MLHICQLVKIVKSFADKVTVSQQQSLGCRVDNTVCTVLAYKPVNAQLRHMQCATVQHVHASKLSRQRCLIIMFIITSHAVTASLRLKIMPQKSTSRLGYYSICGLLVPTFTCTPAGLHKRVVLQGSA